MTTISDDFNRAGPGLGANWTTAVGSPQIISSTKFGTTTTDVANPAFAKHNTALSTDDWDVTTHIQCAGGHAAGMYIRCLSGADISQGYGCELKDNGAGNLKTSIMRLDAGLATYLGLAEAVTSIANGGTYHSLRMQMIGNTIKTWIDGTLIATRVDATYRSGKQLMIGTEYNDTFHDDLSGTEGSGTADTAQVVEVVAGALATSRSPSVTFTSQPKTGDVIVMWPSSTVSGGTTVVPSGWTSPLTTTDSHPSNTASDIVCASDSHAIWCIYHVVTSGEESGAVKTYTATNFFNATQTGRVHSVLIRGADTTTPILAAWSAFSNTGTASPHVLAGLTSGLVTATNAIVVSSVAADGTGTYGTAVQDWQTLSTAGTTQGRWTGLYSIPTTSGSAVGAANITPSSGDEYASITVAVKVASAVLAATEPVGTLTMTGVAPTAAATGAANTTEPVGALTLTGVAPTATGTGAASRAIPIGTLTLGGVAPSGAGSGAATATAPVGALTLTGVAPAGALGGASVALPVGTLTLGGVAPAGSGSGTVTATEPVGALTLTGVAPTSSGTGAATAAEPVGTMILAGVAPTATGTGAVTVALPVGVLTLGGNPVVGAASGATTATIPVGALTLTGNPVVATAGGVSRTIPVGALTLTGVAPSGAAGLAPTLLPTGALTLTGRAPTASGSGAATVALPVGVVVLAGVGPSVQGAGAAQVGLPTGVLALTGAPLDVAGSGATDVALPVGVLSLIGVALAIRFGRAGPFPATSTGSHLTPTSAGGHGVSANHGDHLVATSTGGHT